MTDQVLLRRGEYHDSVTLLRITQAVAGTPGVTAAQVAMATELNVELTRGLGFDVPDASPTDLLIAVRGDDEAAVQAGLAAVDVAIADARNPVAAGFGALAAPRTVRAAAVAAPDAALVLLSVPGPSVLGEALDALDAGRHVMVFSDNVPIEHEVLLKQRADETGLLVMGPDCGTAVVSGVGLGFANVLTARRDRHEGRHRRRLRHRRPAAVLPARRGRRRRLPRARSRRPRPVRPGRRPQCAARTGHARRRSGHRPHRGALQAARPDSGRAGAGRGDGGPHPGDDRAARRG